jgi:hypothetical protein
MSADAVPTDRPAEEPTEQLAEHPAEPAVDEPTDPPADPAGEQLADPTGEPPAEQPGEQLAEPAVEPAVEPPADPTVEQLAGQPAGASEPVALAAEERVPEGPTPADDDDRSREPLVPESFGFESRWDAIQAGFVDEPRRSVAEADALVTEVIDEISAAFAGARAALEEQWSEGGEASTEDLRQAFRRYRSFFQRLLSA